MTEPLDTKAYPLLVVDDEPDNLEAFRLNFRRRFQLLTASCGEAALKLAAEHPVAVVVTDQRMPGMTGLELLVALREVRPQAVGVMLTAYTETEDLLAAINQGHIYRYVVKPWETGPLQAVLVQALQRYHLERENERLVQELRSMNEYLAGELEEVRATERIIGAEGGLEAVLADVAQVAGTTSTVLIRGESGSGKEVVARAVHQASPRRKKPFIRVHCAALAEGVLESELFGHEKGAFTGADRARPGRFELADGGTLFLDEVGDIPLATQIKLLRVVQEREFERVGGNQTRRVDVRLIAATHQNLEAMVDEGSFRHDLFYRLNVFPIFLPPLRDRLQDVPALAEHVLRKLGPRIGKRIRKIDPDALAALKGYSWPGNVRELENILERALILCRGRSISVADLRFTADQRAASTPLSAPLPTSSSSVGEALGDDRSVALSDVLDGVERDYLVAAMEQAEGSKAEAAKKLGMSRSTLYYRLKKHDLLQHYLDD